DLVASAEVPVLVAQSVEAVRAGGDDLLHARVVERRDVLARQRLARALFAHAPRGIAGARLAWPEDRKVDTRRLQQLRRRDRGLARALVEGRRASNPEQDVWGLIARLQDAHAQALRPLRAIGLRPSPRVRGPVDVAQHRAGLLGEPGLDHHEVP